MRIWEFKDNQGYKWLVTEEIDKVKMEVVTFSNICESWDLVDQLKADGKLEFVREYTTIQI